MATTHPAVVANRVSAAIEHAAALDPPAERLGKAVRGAVEPGPVKDALSGSWLGHPLHPVLTQAVVGTWLSGLLLDLAGGRQARHGADLLVAAGVVSALPTAVTGSSDWADAEPADDGVRRVGLVHAAANVAALGLQVASLRARRRGARGRGVALSAVANGLIGFSGWLGGHLGYVQGVGVDQTTFDRGPQEWTAALPAGRLGDEPVCVVAGATPVMLVRDGGTVRALHDRCSHRGCSLAAGSVADGMVECGCHGSRFALEDGRVLRGPAPTPQPVLQTRERDGMIEVRASG